MSGILGFITSFPTLLHSAVIFGTVIMFGAMGEILAEKAGNRAWHHVSGRHRGLDCNVYV